MYWEVKAAEGKNKIKVMKMALEKNVVGNRFMKSSCKLLQRIRVVQAVSTVKYPPT